MQFDAGYGTCTISAAIRRRAGSVDQLWALLGVVCLAST